jgi:hypothetical protein
MADALTTVQGAYAAFGRGDIASVMDTLADDVEWILPQTDSPIGGTHRGKAAVQAWFGALAETLDFQVFDPREFIAQGDKVVVLIHEESTVRSTGKKLNDDLAHVHTYRDGKIVRFQEYSDTAAFKAASQP